MYSTYRNGVKGGDSSRYVLTSDNFLATYDYDAAVVVAHTLTFQIVSHSVAGMQIDIIYACRTAHEFKPDGFSILGNVGQWFVDRTSICFIV